MQNWMRGAPGAGAESQSVKASLMEISVLRKILSDRARIKRDAPRFVRPRVRGIAAFHTGDNK